MSDTGDETNHLATGAGRTSTKVYSLQIKMRQCAKRENELSGEVVRQIRQALAGRYLRSRQGAAQGPQSPKLNVAQKLMGATCLATQNGDRVAILRHHRPLRTSNRLVQKTKPVGTDPNCFRIASAIPRLSDLPTGQSSHRNRKQAQ